MTVKLEVQPSELLGATVVDATTDEIGDYKQLTLKLADGRGVRAYGLWFNTSEAGLYIELAEIS